MEQNSSDNCKSVHFFYRAKKIRKNNQQYTTEDTQSSRNYLPTVSGQFFFHSQLITYKVDLEKGPVVSHAKDKIFRMYLEHANQVCIHQSTEATKAFIQQRYHTIGLRKALASIRFHCFFCRSFDTNKIQPILAPLPSYRFPAAETQCPFAISVVDFFGPFYVEDSKCVVEKDYGLIFTCMVTRAVHSFRLKYRYVSQCLQKILQSSMAAPTSLQ